MVRRFQYGNPMDTGAIIKSLPLSKEEIPYMHTIYEKEKLKFTLTLEEETAIYGLGEQVRGINKRGWIYESYCTDENQHTEDRRSLYAGHNFLIFSGKQLFGLFFDTPSFIQFDLGFTQYDKAVITSDNQNCMVYVIEGNSVQDIVKQFRTLIGKSYVPPKWAFGYQQSRWGYKNETDILQCATKHREENIPLDMIYLDLDYMEDCKDFTIHKERFPDMKRLVATLKKQGIRLIPIIDAGVKVQAGYPVYEEGIKGNYFCKNQDGTTFVGGVWPGKVHFPDVLNEDGRKWFSSWYRVLTDCGIEGFWNDMNEPSLFYSEQGLHSIYEKAKEMNENNLNDFLELQAKMNGLANQRRDYCSMYHTINGKIVCHDEVHNLYGAYMTKGASDALKEIYPEKRTFLLSRSSYIGSHRDGGIWMGDNHSWWSHLLLNLQMLPSLNMCGYLYCGADLGGFSSHVTEDLMLRWLAFGSFVPLMRNHSCIDARYQEIYQFSTMEKMREMIYFRYRFIPYLYSEYMKAVLRDEMLYRPLAFDYPEDKRAKEVEDQLMMGEGLMLAPVYEQNKTGRYVYLPEDMLLVRFKNATEYETTVLAKGDHYISCHMYEIVFFIRKNHILLLGEYANCVEQLSNENMTIIGYVPSKTTYDFYVDDGETRQLSEQFIQQIEIERINEIVKMRGNIFVQEIHIKS